MRTLAVLALLISATAHGAPLPNLVLSCPDASAIGKPGVDSCRGYTYQVPTSELIVSSGSTSANYWRKASDLSGAEMVMNTPQAAAICATPAYLPANTSGSITPQPR